MRIQIKANGFELTSSLRDFIEEKFSPLNKYVARWDEADSVILRIGVAKTTKHHHKGDVFLAEANLDLPHKVLRVEENNLEIHIAIERLKDRLKNELLKIKDKMVEH